MSDKTTAKTAENIDSDIGMPDREKSIGVLNEILADQHVLYIKTRNFHWNLKGSRFHTLHEFFEEQYKALEVAIDDTAERIRMLGGVSPGSMSEFLTAANLKETSGEIIHGDEAIDALDKDHEAAIRSLREAIPKVEDEFNDKGTADFLIELLRAHEETAWMLRSFRD